LATGVDPQRLALLAAVLEKRLGVELWDQDIYLNVAGGLAVEEPAADLAIVAAILSSLFNRPLQPSTLVFGEVGLGGEIRPAMFTGLRLKEASMLGFKRAVIPERRGEENMESAIEIVSVSSLSEARPALFEA
jgi:DNA repair protein RadA/Sms